MNVTKPLLYFSLVLLSAGCTTNFPDIKWDYSDKDITGYRPEKKDQLDIDIYLDATTSMEGFAVNNSSVYSQFLDQLEASALTAWKKADTRFYMFGQTIQPINRNKFLSAKSDHSFYHEKGIFLQTYIDSVVQHTDAKRLSVVITDLFQNEGDVNTMATQFKDKCFTQGVEVGIIGIKSEFNGTVFDVPYSPHGFPLTTNERPFYAIVFGNKYNMELMFDALKVRPFVKEEQFLIVSSHIIQSYDVTLAKDRKSTAITNKKARTEVKNSFDFGMKEDGKEARFDLSIDMNRNKRCADINAGSIELVTFKKSINQHDKQASSDSANSNDITIENMKVDGNTLKCTLALKNEQPAGNYSYLVYLKMNPLNGLVVPAWVKQFSTVTPIPNTPSASQTYNLEKLCSRLLMASASVTPVYIAKFYVNIFKR